MNYHAPLKAVVVHAQIESELGRSLDLLHEFSWSDYLAEEYRFQADNLKAQLRHLRDRAAAAMIIDKRIFQEVLILKKVKKGILDRFSDLPPANPWGINFGGGLNSTALILECIDRDLRPDWILFADTGSELPGILEHVEFMKNLLRSEKPDWPKLTIVRWERQRGDVVGFEPLHETCLRTNYLPSKAYGLAGCTSKWKIQPMEKWRKSNGFDKGAFAIGYDAGESNRITKACARGEDPNFFAWYPLVAWKIDRLGCQRIIDKWEIKTYKSSCFMCPNMKREEWVNLKKNHPDLFEIALEIEKRAFEKGNPGPLPGLTKGSLAKLSEYSDDLQLDIFSTQLEDRCHHGGCFT